MGSIGSPGFELLHATAAFQQLVGPYINGYAFREIGLKKFLAMLKDEKARLKQTRIENGTEAKFGTLTSKEFPASTAQP